MSGTAGKKKKPAPEVEIQITPMLDMAFQLLTFFIMTYHPAPSEVEFGMNLLPAQPSISASAHNRCGFDFERPADRPENPSNHSARGGGGELAQISVGEKDVADLNELKQELKDIVEAKEPFDQVLIQVDPQLKYAELIKVVDVFTQAKFTKLSFSELTADSGQ